MILNFHYFRFDQMFPNFQLNQEDPSHHRGLNYHYYQ